MQPDDRQQETQFGELKRVAPATGELREESRRFSCFASPADLVKPAGEKWRDEKNPEVETIKICTSHHAKSVITSPAIAKSRP